MKNFRLSLLLLTATVLLIGSSVLLIGCGDGVIGTSQDHSADGRIREVTTLKSDYTYQQVFTDNSGHTLTNSGTWDNTPPMNIPGFRSDASSIELKDVIMASDFKDGLPATTARLPRSGWITSLNDFQSSQAQRAQSQSETAIWIIFLRLLVLALWVVAVVDVARREFPTTGAKVGWVLVVVLLGCFGSALYYLFGKSQGDIPDSRTI